MNRAPDREAEIECPHCGDAVRFRVPEVVYDGDTTEDVTCEDCGAAFDVDVRVTITYTTSRLRKPPERDGDDFDEEG